MAAEGSCAQPALLSFTLFARGGEGGELTGPKICNSPLSFGIRPKADHQREACNHSNRRTNEMLFWTREDFAQMSSEALVIVGDSCRSTWTVIWKLQHTKTAHVKCETYTGWKTRFLNINAVSPLRNSDFYCLSLQFYWLACVVSVIAYLPLYSIYHINILGLAEPVEWNIFDVGIHNSS